MGGTNGKTEEEVASVSQQGTCSVQMDLQDGRDRGLIIKLIQKRCTRIHAIRGDSP